MSMQRNVVITGCSVGLGRATALHLARRGWHVFAGVRNDADAKSLEAEQASPGRIDPVRLDVSDAAAIEAARAYVDSRSAGGGLQGLVNNAGYAVNQPIEFASEKDFADQFAVNFLGPIRLIQAFLPELRRARGRIVNVTSGVTKVSQPFVGLYGASKAALDQVSFALRLELEPSGIAVILVDPGLMRTRMTETAKEASESAMSGWSREATERYGGANRANAGRVAGALRQAKTPEVVAALIARALEDTKPRDQYLAGQDARGADLLNRVLSWRAKQALVRRLGFGG